MQQGRRSERHGAWVHAWVQWGVFLGMVALLSALVWGGWSVLHHRIAWPGFGGAAASSTDGTVKVGVTDVPESLDIRPFAAAASTAGENGTTGATNQLGSSADVTALDTVPSAERLLIGNVYETLVTTDQHNQLKPGLATGWTVSEDGLTYTFTIANGATFSNGHTLDATDVVWSMQQSVVAKASGVDALGDLRSVTNPDAHTVVIALGQPNPTLPRALAGPLGAVFDAEGVGIDYATQSAGSGPFIVDGFRPGRSLTLKRNGAYHGTLAASAAVTITAYDDDDALAQAVRSGAIDWAPGLGADVATTLRQGAQSEGQSGGQSDGTGGKVTVSTGATTSKVLLAYNHGNDSLLSDEQVRKAFRHQIDATGIAASQQDSGGALGGPISAMEPGYEDLTGLFPYDTVKAQSMLAYFGDEYLTTVNLVVTERWRSVAETIKNQIEQGARPRVNLEVLPDADYAARIQAGTWEMTILSMNGTDDAGMFVDTDSIFHYDDAEAQQAYASARAATNETDYAARMKTYARALSEDAAADWLYTRVCFTAARASLAGYPTAMVDQRLPLAEVRMG
ncbi:ABC transporter substrate-binding protein [Bifidobacterium sp. UTBIF-78]|uniref:ABC transporter substrate-binding protein n=1 Tax=Bifidobacterium sp. UTBIF-78 TaxID=1465263 RepID=UPI002159570B|nr:ABC transporter substrate-binding protein [Bifidobacterium sp. UTBIF-78]TPF93942.1 ABC transporter substrate-binding protein [Bifidobacterium sp. UTBIF-78]